MNKVNKTSKADGNGARRSKIARRLAMALTVATMSIGTMAAVGSPAQAATSIVPIKGSVAGAVAVTGPNSFHLTGSGNVSHLGKVGYSGDVAITSTDPTTGVISDVLTETLTAANGDTLTLLCQEVATPVSHGVLHGVDQWSVTGGTGRFSDATGSGQADTLANLGTGTFTKDVAGTIDY